ncbi:hypothetical protein MELA_01060 [Candidatus Methylomirabilis lanthanidiphila]|uniref:Protein NO VEIN C-terminal domain-containing protein n=1 Tax=Candidatus Methylomirabilis lanthanidiphila TaxID=2211376 RepID=A0A564ZHT8_9BACT|nr:DUF3883 domain-containing protein [Candidatus Methylomirabilis lanthanidiphila]VUZ84686.1 hypothetical protein MELA_01060 [Candidatus Methylomirabilis lanthanidiphila]
MIDKPRLIERAFPLKQASLDSVHEKNLRHGHISTLHIWPVNEKRSIEVKGRSGTGDVEVLANEWAKACNLRDEYRLYVVYDCATPSPRLVRVQDFFGSLLARVKGSVLIGAKQVTEAGST